MYEPSFHYINDINNSPKNSYVNMYAIPVSNNMYVQQL